jgi:hypothetical protein
MANTLMAVVKFTSAKAFPLNTDLRTTKPLIVFGTDITPEAIPAFNFAATLPAIALPL